MCPESGAEVALSVKEHLEFYSRKTERTENFRAPTNVLMFGQRHIRFDPKEGRSVVLPLGREFELASH